MNKNPNQALDNVKTFGVKGFSDKRIGKLSVAQEFFKTKQKISPYLQNFLPPELHFYQPLTNDFEEKRLL